MAKARKHKRETNIHKKSKPKTVISEIPGHVSMERSPFMLSGKMKYLSTGIDMLYAHIIKEKNVRLSAAARKFNVDKELIEEWGSILEDHHMIEMHYPVAGEPMLKIPLPKKKRGKEDDKHRKKKKPKKKGKPLHLKLTKKRLLIMAEIIILGEFLIYIFFVNTHLRENFIPTLNYQLANIPANIMNLPGSLFGISTSINPIYFVICMFIVVFWIAIVVMSKKRKKHKKAFK